MGKSKKSKVYNLIFIVVIALLIIPQTRQSIQVLLNKGIASIVKPSVIESAKREALSSYDWTLRDISGHNFNFKTAEGKVIIINFWATWCPPCIAEMPSLEELYKRYQANDEVVFLFVSNEETQVLSEFVTKKNYSFQVHQSLTNYPAEFDVTSIPRTFIISKNGEIVIDKSGAADWSSERVTNTIDELLKAF